MEISQASVKSSCPYHTTSSLPIPNHAINSALIHVSAYISRRSGSFSCAPKFPRNAAESSPRFRQCRFETVDRSQSQPSLARLFCLCWQHGWLIARLSRWQERIARLCPWQRVWLPAADLVTTPCRCTTPVAVAGQCDPSKCKRSTRTRRR